MESVEKIPDSASIQPHFQEVHERFARDGFVILRQFAEQNLVQAMLDATLRDCRQHAGPIEYESDLRYPGAPHSKSETGGSTIRRLKQAHCRDVSFTDWVNYAPLKSILSEILGPELVCPLAHHNCIMTKAPAYSSDTGWHQDIRYWSFERPELVSAWLALGNEMLDNGCLQVVPGSHRMPFRSEQFDSEKFFRNDLPENQEILNQCVPVQLRAGDVLLFHCKTLHAASRNHTDETKYSVVFTFRAGDNSPQRGTRSSSSPELLLH